MLARATRQAIVDACQRLARAGYLAGTGGNLALRVDAAHFAVTPSASDYYSMRAEDVSVLRLDDLAQVEGERPPSVESSLHARVLRARPDCACSLHTHQPVASACSLLGRSLPVSEAADRLLLGREVGWVGYAPSGTGWLASRLARAVRPDVHAYLMRNHGALVCAADVDTAARAVAALEDLAARWLLAKMQANLATPGVAPAPCVRRVAALLRSAESSRLPHAGEGPTPDRSLKSNRE